MFKLFGGRANVRLSASATALEKVAAVKSVTSSLGTSISRTALIVVRKITVGLGVGLGVGEAVGAAVVGAGVGEAVGAAVG
jgi:uncharacterized spore protein YtfJ